MVTNMDKRRWGVLAASCIMNVFGGSFYAWSVFAGPLAGQISAHTGQAVTSANLAIVFTMTCLFCPIPMIIGGWISDKFGPRWTVFFCGILFGLALILSGHATSVGMLVVTYSVLISISAGMIYSCAIGNAVKFFPDRRGFVSGLTTACNGMGAVVVSLAASALGVAENVSRTMTIIGAAAGGIIVICSFFLIKCPDGYAPDGYTHADSVSTASEDKNWKQMLRDGRFYLMLVLLLCGAFFGLVTVSQASPIAQNMVGMSAGAAAAAVSILALCNAVGRVIAGIVSDRLGRVNTIAGLLILATAAMVLLYFTGRGDVAQLYISLCVIGVCFGALMGIYPSFTTDNFGSAHNSVNYAIVFIGYSLAGLVAPLLISRIYISTGTYQPAFLIAIFAALAALALTFIYRAVNRKK